MKNPYLESLAIWDHKSKFCLRDLVDILNELDNPQDQVKTIHIGGTNGKGTVAVALASILNAYGFSVGLTISPHLVDLRERISINGNLISEQSLNLLLGQIEVATRKLNKKVTYHEALTIAAFLAFKNLDYAVIEVGLGGRFDASNCIKKPELAVITSIAKDHVAILGDTYRKIAKEKAGIIKKDSTVLIGELPVEAEKIMGRFSRKQNARLIKVKNDRNSSTKIINEKIAIKAAELLGIPNKFIDQGLRRYYWPGRMELISYEGKDYLIDAAHNPAALSKLIEHLKHLNSKVQLLFAALDSKDWQNMLLNIIPYIEKVILLESDSLASVPTAEMAGFIKNNSELEVKEFSKNYGDAIKHSKNFNGLSLITGSLYLIGNLRPYLAAKEIKYWK